MIFITFGTQSCDFSRCIHMIEDLISTYKIDEDIIAQTGYTSCNSTLFKHFSFVNEADYQRYIENARIIISHAGTGALFSSIKKGKKVIAVARLNKYGEMVDDHQTEIVKKLSKDGYILDGTHSLIDAWKKLDDFNPRPCDFSNTLVEEIGKQLDNWLK